jgi:DNA polymerase-3 subunit beta
MRQPVFSGVLFENTEESLNMVATDSFRLTKYSLTLLEKIDQDIKPVVPYVSLDQVLRLCGESEEDIVEAYLVSKNNQILFKTGRIEVSTSLLDGDYPNYKAILPDKTVGSYRVDVQELIDGVKLSNVFSAKEDITRIRFKKEVDTQITLFSKVAELGEYETQISVETLFEEEPLEIDFSPKKLIDILSKLNTDKLILDIVIKPRTEHRMLIMKEDQNENFIHLVMPLAGG